MVKRWPLQPHQTWEKVFHHGKLDDLTPRHDGAFRKQENTWQDSPIFRWVGENMKWHICQESCRYLFVQNATPLFFASFFGFSSQAKAPLFRDATVAIGMFYCGSGWCWPTKILWNGRASSSSSSSSASSASSSSSSASSASSSSSASSASASSSSSSS